MRFDIFNPRLFEIYQHVMDVPVVEEHCLKLRTKTAGASALIRNYICSTAIRPLHRASCMSTNHVRLIFTRYYK